MKKFLLIISFFFTSVIFLTACSQDDTKSKEVYTVATGVNYVPFAFLNEDTGQLDGFDIDLMKAIAKEANLEIKFELVDWDGFIAATQKGHFDMGIYGVTITEERKTKVDFSDPYYSAGLMIMVPSQNNNIKSEKDLVGKKVGTVARTTSEDYLRKNHPQAEIVTFLGSPELYMELTSGRIDAVLYDLPSVEYFIAKDEGKKFKTVGETLQGEEYGILLPQDSPLLEKVNKALETLIKKGIYDDLYEKWFNERPFGT